MSSFSCPVARVASVENHENADRLSIVRLEGLGFVCISGKLDDGSHRYKPGDRVVYIPSASLLPEWLLKEMDFWDKEKNKGTLAGSNGDRVKPLRLRGVFSEGVLYPVQWASDAAGLGGEYVVYEWSTGVGLYLAVTDGDDVSQFLGVTKYEPPIPTSMAGQVANCSGLTTKYDFDRWEQIPDIFEPSELVVATEKLHGTCTAILFHPGLKHPEMFGTQGEIMVHSKGLGAQGLAFKNVEENRGNLYVRQLNALLEHGFEDKLRALSRQHNDAVVCVMGETFGGNVQDLGYGLKAPEFRAFDISIGGDWLDPHEFALVAQELGLVSVPVLYSGPFELAALEKVRDGKSTIGLQHVREGVVVRAINQAPHPMHGRRIAKFISPDYLTRKVKNGEATEFQ